MENQNYEYDMHKAEESVAYLQKYIEESNLRSEERQRMIRNIIENLKELRESLELEATNAGQ